MKALSAKAFNALVASRRANRLVEIKQEPAADWAHPWQVGLSYTEESGWKAMIRPGFVYHLAATLPVTGDDGKTKDVPLTRRPEWPLVNFRAIGPAAQPISLGTSGDTITATFETVPKYFAYLGVGQPPVIAGDGLNPVQTGTEAQKRTERLLKACDLVLYQDHPATQGTVQVSDPSTGRIVSVDASFVDTSSHKLRAYLKQTARYVPPQPNADAFTAALNGWEDATKTELHLATVYFVSPPGVGNAAPLDGTWTPYVQHHVWWNLDHATNVIGNPLNVQPLRLIVPLAGGVGQPLIDALLGILNDATSTLAQFLGNQRYIGKFWTA